MSKSIIKGNQKNVCFLCHKITQTENHHIFGGGSRTRADRDGLTVYLCHDCHNEPPNGVHYNKDRNDRLKRIGQITWMRVYGKTKEDFIKAYGRNYL